MNTKLLPVSFLSSGYYVPDRIITNEEIEKSDGIPAAWIKQVCGVEQRHKAEPNQSASDLGCEAGKLALQRSGLKPEEIDLVIVATTSPDMISPPTAAFIHHKLGTVNAAAFDLSAACIGFIWAINITASLLQTGMFKNALVIATELGLRCIDNTDKDTYILLGDGAGALVMQASQLSTSGILTSFFRCDSAKKDAAMICTNWAVPHQNAKIADGQKVIGGVSLFPEDKSFAKQNLFTFKMKGRQIFKFAVDAMREAILKVISDAGIKKEEIKLIIPHQANLRILEAAAKRLDFPAEKYYFNIQNYGNTGGASPAIALAEADAKGLIKRGDFIILVGFGAGLGWGATLIKW